MKQSPGDLFIFLFSLLILGPTLFLAWYIPRRRRAAWGAFAEKYGWVLAANRLRITGRYEGRQIELETERRGSGKSSFTVTVIRVAVDDAFPPDFSLEREGLGDKFLKLFGKADAEIGHEAFDRYFDLTNLSPLTARLLRDPEVQRRLYVGVNAYRDFSITGGWLLAEQRGVPWTPEAVEDFIHPALSLVDTLLAAR